MKKLFILTFISFISLSTYAQDDSETKETIEPTSLEEQVKVAFNIGAISGNDISRDRFSLALSADFNYLKPVTKNLHLGIGFGIVNLQKDNESEYRNNSNENIIHFGGTFRFYNDSGKFYLGSDLGYSFGLGNNGSLFFRPRVGMQISKCSGINVTYFDVDSDQRFNSVTIGYEFTF